MAYTTLYSVRNYSIGHTYILTCILAIHTHTYIYSRGHEYGLA